MFIFWDENARHPNHQLEQHIEIFLRNSRSKMPQQYLNYKELQITIEILRVKVKIIKGRKKRDILLARNEV